MTSNVAPKAIAGVKFIAAGSFSLHPVRKSGVLLAMLWARAALILCISLFTVGLQAAPGPYVLCVTKCEVLQSGDPVEMVCWSGPSKSGCCIVGEESGCGRCEEPVEIADMGCCVADASCPPPETCRQFPCDSDQSCPYGQPECFYCLPGRIVADKAPRSDQDNDNTERYILESATTYLAQSDIEDQASHTHSPPGSLRRTDSGSDICIENCLLLI